MVPPCLRHLSDTDQDVDHGGIAEFAPCGLALVAVALAVLVGAEDMGYRLRP